MRPETKKGALLVASSGLCWGISSCFAQYIFQNIAVTTTWLVSIRLVCAGSLLLLMGCLFDGAKHTFSLFLDKKSIPRFLLFSLGGLLWSQIGYFNAIRYSNAPTATVLQGISAVFTLGLVCIGARKLPRLLEMAAIGVCVLGIWILCTHGDFSSMQLSPLALCYGLAGAAGGAVHTVFSGPILKKYSTWSVVGGGMLAAGIVMCGLIRPWQTSVEWTLPALLCLAGIIVMGTAMSYSLFLKGASMVGAVAANILAKTEPISSLILSTLLLGTSFVAADLVGFALILTSAVLLAVCRVKYGT